MNRDTILATLSVARRWLERILVRLDSNDRSAMRSVIAALDPDENPRLRAALDMRREGEEEKA
jgi:hypothetical protein